MEIIGKSKSKWSTNTYRGPASSIPWLWAERGRALAGASPRPEALCRKLWWPRPHHYCCTPSPSGSWSPAAYKPKLSTVCQWAAKVQNELLNRPGQGRGERERERATHRGHLLGHKTVRFALQQLYGKTNVGLVAFLKKR